MEQQIQQPAAAARPIVEVPLSCVLGDETSLQNSADFSLIRIELHVMCTLEEMVCFKRVSISFRSQHWFCLCSSITTGDIFTSFFKFKPEGHGLFLSCYRNLFKVCFFFLLR